ncbi:hypothetical protein MTP04_22230 [Lysinibacillus sp. PLM2]|nr:hypothetical protein MTP04_22230 [Lysinibacillus sp. PLM2]
MDLGITIEELRQSLIGIVAQSLIQIGLHDERKALFEILSDIHLYKAITATTRGEEYRLPEQETLVYQSNDIEVNAQHVHSSM